MQLQVGGPFGRSRVRGANSVRKGLGDPGGRSLGDTNAARSRRSHLGGPLRGVLHHRLAEAVIHVGSHLNPRAGPEPLRTPVGLVPAQRSGCLHPARSARLPARLGLISQTAAAAAELAGPVRGQLGGPLVRSAGQARRKPGGRARPREGRRRPRGSLRRDQSGTPLPPPLLPRRWAGHGFLAPGSLPAGLDTPPRLLSGTAAAPPGPCGPELFLGRYGRQ